VLSRRRFCASTSAVCAAAFVPRFASATRVLTAADVHVDGYPTVEAVRWIGRELERETGGRLAVRMYHAGQLGRENDTVNLARFGALDLTRVNLAALNNAFPLTRILSLPYVFDSTAHMRRAVDGAPGRAILAGFATRELVGLAFYDSGARCFFNTRRAIVTPSDLHGLKVRVPPSDIFMALVRALGANPTPLAYGEVYSALQTRLIDGAENNWRSFHTSRQFEVARFWAQSEHSYSPEALLMSRRRFDELSASDRELLLSLATRSVPYMRELWDRAEAESRAHVTGAGVRVSEVDRAAFHGAAQPVLERHLHEATLARLHRGIRDLA
jgi:tripartite ATP-independent transporter DctP family solute receptor